MANPTITLTQARLKELLHYDPDTGVFTWAMTRGPAIKGRAAESIDREGYGRISINKTHYRAHRLAWFYVHGVWPKGLIDHKNGNPADNSLENLREVTFTENCQNIKSATKRSTTGFLGVRVAKQKSRTAYQAAIVVNGEFVYLGTYSTPEEAHGVYLEAKERLHPAYVPHSTTSN